MNIDVLGEIINKIIIDENDISNFRRVSKSFYEDIKDVMLTRGIALTITNSDKRFFKEDEIRNIGRYLYIINYIFDGIVSESMMKTDHEITFLEKKQRNLKIAILKLNSSYSSIDNNYDIKSMIRIIVSDKYTKELTRDEFKRLSHIKSKIVFQEFDFQANLFVLNSLSDEPYSISSNNKNIFDDIEYEVKEDKDIFNDGHIFNDYYFGISDEDNEKLLRKVNIIMKNNKYVIKGDVVKIEKYNDYPHDAKYIFNGKKFIDLRIYLNRQSYDGHIPDIFKSIIDFPICYWRNITSNVINVDNDFILKNIDDRKCINILSFSKFKDSFLDVDSLENLSVLSTLEDIYNKSYIYKFNLYYENENNINSDNYICNMNYKKYYVLVNSSQYYLPNEILTKIKMKEYNVSILDGLFNHIHLKYKDERYRNTICIFI